MGKSTKMI